MFESIFQFIERWDLGIVVGVAGVCIALWAYFKPRTSKRPVYGVRSFTIADNTENKVEGLSLIFSGKPVSKVTVSKLVFMNKGHQAIRSSDIAPASPLLIYVFKNAEILDIEVVAVTRPAINVEVVKTHNEFWQLKFDHLNSDDGCVLRIFHTGDPNELGIIGSLIDAPPIQRRDFAGSGKGWSGYLEHAAFSGAALMFAMGFNIFLVGWLKEGNTDSLLSALVLFLGAILLPTLFLSYRRIPKELRKTFWDS